MQVEHIFWGKQITKQGSKRLCQRIQDKSIEQVKKDPFMLTKGKIHNKEIMYMNL